MLRVVAIGPSQGQYKEADVATGAVITPGHIVDVNSTGQATVNGTAGKQPVMVAVENDIFGKGIDDNWTEGERLIYQHLMPGHEFYGLVAAEGAAIAYDALIECHTDGTIKATSTAANAIGRARTAVDNSAGTAPARVRVLVI